MPRRACRDCGQPIDLIHTEHDSWLPVDPYPQEGGNVVLRSDEYGLVAVVLGPKDAKIQARIQPMYKSHHATCPKRQRPVDDGARQLDLLGGGS